MSGTNELATFLLLTRRRALYLIASASLLAASRKAAFAATTPTTDWSRAVVEGTLALKTTPKDLGGWCYAVSLYLYGQYLVYKRTGEKKYFDAMQAWVDAHVSEDGAIDRPLSALDYMLPGNLLLVLYQETKAEKYKKAAISIRTRFDTYPRTEEGAFWHALSREHQLWLDGMYMSMPFLVRYGKAFGEEKYVFDEAAHQLLTYAKHLNDPASGLMFHAYDELGKQPWSDPVTHHSAIFWCRAIGWFGMALIEVLELMPHTHPKRDKLIALVRQLTTAYAKYQDKATGRWYQVVDQNTLIGNWLETSSSAMYTYTIAMAVRRGYIARSHMTTGLKGYRGVLSQVTLDDQGHAHIANICEGTNVSNLNYYLQRKRNTDDFHGLGAFLIMNEAMRGSV